MRTSSICKTTILVMFLSAGAEGHCFRDSDLSLVGLNVPCRMDVAGEGLGE